MSSHGPTIATYKSWSMLFKSFTHFLQIHNTDVLCSIILQTITWFSTSSSNEEALQDLRDSATLANESERNVNGFSSEQKRLPCSPWELWNFLNSVKNTRSFENTSEECYQKALQTSFSGSCSSKQRWGLGGLLVAAQNTSKVVWKQLSMVLNSRGCW